MRRFSTAFAGFCFRASRRLRKRNATRLISTSEKSNLGSEVDCAGSGFFASAFRELTEEINPLEGLFDGRLAIGLHGADPVHVLFEAARAYARAASTPSFPVFAKIAISFAGMGHPEAALEAIREIRDPDRKSVV